MQFMGNHVTVMETNAEVSQMSKSPLQSHSMHASKPKTTSVLQSYSPHYNKIVFFKPAKTKEQINTQINGTYAQMGFCSAAEKNEMLPLMTSWAALEITVLTVISQTHEEKCHMISCLCKTFHVTGVEKRIMVTRVKKETLSLSYKD